MYKWLYLAFDSPSKKMTGWTFVFEFSSRELLIKPTGPKRLAVPVNSSSDGGQM
jgi:hypothetical protein